ncbi:MAG: hypothetical protein JO010_13385 [Alphaproteobacteria bacterium]|nr:hypothetical protein [Alphaproteobacteria bacterium]
MTQERDRDYFARRQTQERIAAWAASKREVRAIHLQLAYHYAGLIAKLDERPTPRATQREETIN